jgi:hypothetical protein
MAPSVSMDGLILSRSMSEMVACDRPDRTASSRTGKPRLQRSSFSFCPTKAMTTPFKCQPFKKRVHFAQEAARIS